jgi:hypothetical protein
MTEDEAKTKWCFAFTASHTDPRAREYLNADGAFDADASGPFRHHCIGSDCMAWRSAGRVDGVVVERVRAEPGSVRPDGWSYEAVDGERASAGGDWVRREHGPPTGFCGLAGAPS